MNEEKETEKEETANKKVELFSGNIMNKYSKSGLCLRVNWRSAFCVLHRSFICSKYQSYIGKSAYDICKSDYISIFFKVLKKQFKML